MDVKKPTTLDEQISILQARGLIIVNEQKAKDILSRLNYYTLTGYLHEFKKSDGKYIDGLSFEKISNIYECDRRLNNILLYAIDLIEHTLKTKIAYIMSHRCGELSYKDCSNFKNENEHNIFVSKFTQNIENNKNLPFVAHHLKKYDGNFPIWVAVELFTLGMVDHFYKNLNTQIQKEIADDYNIGVRQLQSWINNVAYLRNMVAHYMRLYNFKISKTPTINKKDTSFPSPSYKIYDIVYIMKFLILNKSEWNNYILPAITNIFDKYDDYIDVSAFGFPENWQHALIIT